ncbi:MULTISPECIES: type III secretion system ATPase SctN [Ralstonia solanacearum species complex]|uniref:type III secretion system ATPase SctN n=1 Tax=Ralstonia solanacearum species complex TaxID=3116862 RepID=UPI00078B9FEA|nr:type III secretion system ATPase SctN [Ralstonia solanacearum]BEU74413.1 type III secretion system ATPase SctN [Ralstonia pseudosolanacearum]AMP39846.1 EscN/YscN/HrcN family type III secretion system ATPase [Ralstonia solanacearum]AXV79275.1 EscN/YscN/HrcN family type III secretion system ATPase [Ralstonia solanacearum]AXV88689.1 EscN/YscN/HrcN family type III secretion system ATPase [Ralstonia solanacearum]AXV93297.1 EscN/YscN/HrcN family type III secretion system ATPase [Ralstonia solanac
MTHLALLESLENAARTTPLIRRFGKVVEVTGTLLRVGGVDVRLGELCTLTEPDGTVMQEGEVVGFSEHFALVAPFGGVTGLSRSTRVVPSGRALSVGIGPGLLGRVLDGLGRPADGGPPLEVADYVPVFANAPDPMTRRLVEQPLATGVRVIDGLATLAEGQRMGIFAPAGVGKSTLMGMFARGTDCDVNVIVLIGERGREVREFIEQILGEEGMRRSVVVCATSDRSAVERAKAAYVGTAVAEYFRDQGLRVLLMMDSLTRFARAQREIGLAAGEPPTRRGFPPSVFAELPRLLERAGMSAAGSITALYTVLAEDESGNDPVAEEVRGILDGHLILSRDIAARNRYPAIDILNSLSRVMTQVMPREHCDAAGRMRQLLAKYNEVETLLQMGEYKEGSDPVADAAVQWNDWMESFLRQRTDEWCSPDETRRLLDDIAQS